MKNIYMIFKQTKPIQSSTKKVYLMAIMSISSSNPMFYHLLESSHQDDSNKWLNIGFGEEITQVESIEVNFMHHIWSPVSSTEICY